MKRDLLAIAWTMGTSLNPGIVAYEANVFPEVLGWERIGSGGAFRYVEESVFIQVGIEVGAVDDYRLSLGEFADAQEFFMECRVQTDAPSSILDGSGTPVVLVAGGPTTAFYHITITDQRVRFFRSTSIPLVFVEIDPGVPHTYRLELIGVESYAWYLDDHVIDSGVPAGPYPAPESVLTWGSRHYETGQTTRWDYVRCGRLPVEASGDFDSDEDVDGRDFYFVQECFSHSGPARDAGPGCRFADFDDDTDVDLEDIAAFQRTFTGPN